MIRHLGLLGLALIVAGCAGNPSASPLDLGGSSGTVTWVAGNEASPGIDRGTVYAVGTSLVIWADASGGGGGRGKVDAKGASGDGHVVLQGGRKVEFSYAIRGDRTGRVLIDGAPYELGRGNLFLVKADGEELRVIQLRRDLAGFNLDPEYFKSLGRSDGEINRFFVGRASGSASGANTARSGRGSVLARIE